MESALDAIFDSDSDELSDVDETDVGGAVLSDDDDDVNDDHANSLEDSELGSQIRCLDLEVKDSSFIDSELDATMHNSKQPTFQTKKKKKKKRKNETNERKLVIQICHTLQEPKRHLIETAVKRLGWEIMNSLLAEVETIESKGGQMTADRKRRRTPGGVLLNVLKSRHCEDYKAIMASAREIEKERQQRANRIDLDRKRKVDANSMDIDPQAGAKRQRDDHRFFTIKASDLNPVGTPVWPIKKQPTEAVESKVDPNNVQALAQVISAWVNGVNKGVSTSHEMVVVNDDISTKPVSLRERSMVVNDDIAKKPLSLSERIRAPVRYDDL